MKSSYLLCLSLPVLILLVFLLMFVMYSPVFTRETFSSANASQKTVAFQMQALASQRGDTRCAGPNYQGNQCVEFQYSQDGGSWNAKCNDAYMQSHKVSLNKCAPGR